MVVSTVCSICSFETEGNYCNNCGQQIGKKETTFKSMIIDLVTSSLDLDKSVFANIFKIIIDPSKLVMSYWNGNKKYYPSPFRVLIYALALAAFHLTYVNSKILGIYLNTAQVDAQISFWIIMLPLLTLTSYLTFFRIKHSFTKHLISLIYIGASVYILITVVHDILLFTVNADLDLYVFPVFIGIIFVENARIFTKNKRWWVILLNALLQLVVILSLVFLSLALFQSVPGLVEINGIKK